MIDTHAHLTSDELIEYIEGILERAKGAQVEKIVNICTDRKTLERGIALNKRYPWVYNTAATTPHDVAEDGETFFPFVEEAAKNKQLIAIGETGLDYYYEHSDRLLQQKFLIRYFHLALKYHLPLVIHCRAAFLDLFSLADSEYKHAPAVLHCFTGNLDEAKEVVARGWYLSCSGIITFKKSQELRDVIKYVPIDHLFIETDAPYLAPQSKRGKVNESSFIQETARMIATVKEISLEEVLEKTTENAFKFFSFPLKR